MRALVRLCLVEAAKQLDTVQGRVPSLLQYVTKVTSKYFHLKLAASQLMLSGAEGGLQPVFMLPSQGATGTVISHHVVIAEDNTDRLLPGQLLPSILVPVPLEGGSPGPEMLSSCVPWSCSGACPQSLDQIWCPSVTNTALVRQYDQAWPVDSRLEAAT